MWSLFAIGLCLCVANVWYAAARSTIPSSLSGTVTKKRVGIEKHPGMDDAYLITLDSGKEQCIDAELFDQLATGAVLEKRAWEKRMSIDGHIKSLTWSRDFQGLIWCMLVALVIMGAIIRLSIPASLIPSQHP